MTESEVVPPAPGLASGAVTSGEPPIDAPPPPIEPPQRILPSVGKSASGDWRDKYLARGGREAACVEAAAAACGVLIKVQQYTREHGGTPIFPDELFQVGKDGTPGPFFSAWVLTCDAILPDAFEMRPEITTAVTSSIVVTQAAIAARRGKGKPKLASVTPIDAAARASGAGRVDPKPVTPPIEVSEAAAPPSANGRDEPGPAPEPPPRKKKSADTDEWFKS